MAAARRATAVEPAQEEWLVETVAGTSDQGIEDQVPGTSGQTAGASDQGIEDQVPGTSGQTAGASTESPFIFETPNNSVFTNAGSTQSPMHGRNIST
jgi:hypothetical protein